MSNLPVTPYNAASNAALIDNIESIIAANAKTDPQFCVEYINRLESSGVLARSMAELIRDLSKANYGVPCKQNA